MNDLVPGPTLFPEPSGNSIVSLGREWVIGAEPHIMLMLKRIFPGLSKSTRGEFRLRRSPEVDRNLQWIMERWTFNISDRDRREMHAGAEWQRRHEREVSAILAGRPSDRDWPMAVEPRDYQKVGAEWMWEVRKGLLGDEVGLGKTLTALATFSRPGHLPALIVCPLDLNIQWREQIERCYPTARVHIVRTGALYDIPDRTAKEEKQAGKEPGKGWPDFVVLNYDKLAKWGPSLAKANLKTVVYDEVQALRHHDSDRYAGAMALTTSVETIQALSATPIFNYGEEFYNIGEVVRPGFLGTREEFKQEWCTRGNDGKSLIREPRAFGKMLRETGFMLRRTRKEIGRELPPLKIVPHQISAQLSIHGDDMAALRRMAELIVNPPTGYDAARQIRDARRDFDVQMRKLTGIAKAPQIASLAEMLIESGEPVIILAWHRDVWNILAKKLEAYHPVFITGEESAREKHESKRTFIAGARQPGGCKVIGISLRSCAGIDGLQHVCSTGITAEYDWTGAVEKQGIGRASRDGQERPVVWYRPYMLSGADPVMLDVCGVKEAQSSAILDPDAVVSNVEVDPNHIRKLAEDFLRRVR